MKSIVEQVVCCPALVVAICLCVPARSHATGYRAEIYGIVTEVTAIYEPLYDPSEIPPPPEIDAEFAARFALGQAVVTQLNYTNDAIDNVVADYWGQYPLANVGSIFVDGEQFTIGPGVINIQTNQPYMPRSDRFFFHSYTSQAISEPIAASGIWLDVSIEGQGMFDTDSLVAPPSIWDTAFGALYFNSGLEWQALGFLVDRVVVTTVPEPSSPCLGILLASAIIYSRRRLTRRCR